MDTSWIQPSQLDTPVLIAALVYLFRLWVKDRTKLQDLNVKSAELQAKHIALLQQIQARMGEREQLLTESLKAFRGQLRNVRDLMAEAAENTKACQNISQALLRVPGLGGSSLKTSNASSPSAGSRAKKSKDG